jgi:hypothetical protein
VWQRGILLPADPEGSLATGEGKLAGQAEAGARDHHARVPLGGPAATRAGQPACTHRQVAKRFCVKNI